MIRLHALGHPSRIRSSLRQLRNKHGWTQARTADLFNLGQSYLMVVERGKRNVALVNLETMAQGFGLTLAQLFSRL